MTTNSPDPHADAFAISQRPAILAVHGLSEVLATFALVAGTFFILAQVINPLGLAWPLKGLAVGAVVGSLIVAIVVSPLGALSGAHMNPAVSFAFWIEGSLSRREFAVYAGAQMAGAILAALLMHALLPTAFAGLGEGLTRPAEGLGPAAAVAIEFAATLGLVSMLFVMMSRKSLTAFTALMKGGYVALAILVLLPLTGPSLNPARSLGPALVAGRFDAQWIYLVAPLLGAAAAVALHRLIPALPRPIFHRFNHDHRHPHYTHHVLARFSARAAPMAGSWTNPDRRT